MRPVIVQKCKQNINIYGTVSFGGRIIPKSSSLRELDISYKAYFACPFVGNYCWNHQNSSKTGMNKFEISTVASLE